ncbi:unnamed protein product [Tuwongella immobilis]|uniref:Uncharacterized protein n=1 Tax=Tuwongella immobilis TaxID=692036 RepID=A0A6C2YQ43_9BACT|nr:unnamed protein product [Tuwongella immobilis]VTS04396.1 unnamed protein product [Tuwongella immobilis]
MVMLSNGFGNGQVAEWQTHSTQNRAPKRRVGSTPTLATQTPCEFLAGCFHFHRHPTNDAPVSNNNPRRAMIHTAGALHFNDRLITYFPVTIATRAGDPGESSNSTRYGA